MTKPIMSSCVNAPASALLNRYPYVGGHLMVVPYKEVADLNGLTEEEVAEPLETQAPLGSLPMP